MDVDVILDAHKGTVFLPDEIGEVDCRVVATKEGPKVVVIAYQCKLLNPTERELLAGLREYLIGLLQKAKYNVKRSTQEA